MKSKRVLLWIVAVLTGLVFLPCLTMAQIQKADVQTQDDYMRIIRANQVTGQVNPQDILKARKQVESMMKMKNGKALDLNWQEMGPDNVASRTRSILIDRNNSSVLYIGSVTGGVWKSTSGGTSWVQTLVNGSTTEVLNATCLAQNQSGTIFAGTGEGFYPGTGTGHGGNIGKGIFKSTDGMNFTLISTTQPTANSTTADWAYVNRLAVNASGRLFAATNKGLRYTDDEGANWTFAKSNGTDLTENAQDIKIGSGGMIVVCVGITCYISATGDPAFFVNHSTGGTDNLPLPSVVSRIELAIAPSDNNVIYAVVVKTTGALENIYRSPDKGTTWKVVGPGGSSAFNIFNIGTATNTGQGGYSTSIAVSPVSPNTIYIGGVNMWRGVKVDEGYFSWEPISDGTFLPSFYPMYLHSYHHSYVFHPSNPDIMYIATDGGIYMTIDAALTFQSLNRNYNVAQAYTVAPSYKGDVLFGTQGSGVQIIDFTGNTQQSALQLYSGDVGGNCAISFINPKVYFVGTSNGASRRSIDNGVNFSAFYSTDMSTLSGAYVTPLLFWESFNDHNSIDSIEYISYDTIAHDQPFTVRSKNGDYPFTVVNSGTTIYPHDTVMIQDIITSKFFLGTNGALWCTKRALDFTITPDWTKIANFSGTVQSMANTNDADAVFLGLQEGLLLRVKGISAYEIDTNVKLELDTIMIKAGRAITSIAVDPDNNDHIVVTLGNYGNSDYVYLSVNALSAQPTFTPKQGNLPAMPVYTSAILKHGSNRVLVGTEMGAFATDNINAGTVSWSPENTGMANAPVMMLKQQNFNHWPLIKETDTVYCTNYGMVYAATLGRGIFKCDKYVGIDNPVNPSTIAGKYLKVYPNPVVNQANIEYTLDRPGTVTLQVMNITGQLVREVKLKNQSMGAHTETISFNNKLTSGTYLIKLKSGSSVNTCKFVVL
ncbi:MAG: T9SS type A sorting domain-containing protein [Bacteroidetes bacterium]|nr:T9SS type A sorting domain-containing protein [Bacteroidota bacterium]